MELAFVFSLEIAMLAATHHDGIGIIFLAVAMILGAGLIHGDEKRRRKKELGGKR